MGKNNRHHQKLTKQQSFGIRKLNGRVLSLAIGTTLFLSLQGAIGVQAHEEGIETHRETEIESNVVEEELTLTSKADSLPIEESTETTITETPIEKGHFRIHLPKEIVEEAQPEETKLWLWGGVKDPSGENGKPKWPNGEALTKDHQTDYGYFYDVPQSEQVNDINYLVIQKDEKLTPEDQKIQLNIPQMNEIYLDETFNQSYYPPLQDENLLKINYYRPDGNYQDYRLWIWGDVESKSEDISHWPHGQIFELDPKYGASSLVRLNKGLQSKVNFLIVNVHHDQQKTIDLTFEQRQTDSQLFIKDGDNTVYTNPYFVDLTPKIEKGTQEVEIKASVDKPFNYKESGIIDLTIQAPATFKAAKIEVDTTKLGSNRPLFVSPELMKSVVTVSPEVKPGTYQLPITVISEANEFYTSQLEVMITPYQKQPDEIDWDEEIIYFMVTDRFEDGDPSNNNPYNMPYDEAKNKMGTYQGGDFRGIINKLDYLKQLGITSIWITPIVQNIVHDVGNEKDGEYYAYHGYWASDFEKLNKHLGTLADFHELIDRAAEANIKIMVDVVLNHAGYGMNSTTSKNPKKGYPTLEEQKVFDGMFRTEDLGGDVQTHLAGLPDFKTEDHKVRDQLVKWQIAWLDHSKTEKGNSIAYYRVDTVKHVEPTTWQHFKNELATKNPKFRLIGEEFSAKYQQPTVYLSQGMMDSLLDFGFKDIAQLVYNGHLEEAMNHLQKRNEFLTPVETLGQFLSSHDEPGFLYKNNHDSIAQLLGATLQLTAKGQPVIYYGEEIGMSGDENWPFYDNRYLFNWSEVEEGNNQFLDHYHKLIAFRRAYSQVLSRGTHQSLFTSDPARWMMYSRNYNDESVLIGLNRAQQDKQLKIFVDSKQSIVVDHYTDKEYEPTLEGDQWVVKLTLPAAQKGGTVLLHTAAGSVIGVEEYEETITSVPELKEGHVRIHFEKLPNYAVEDLGIWLWNDFEKPSINWPNDAISLNEGFKTPWGYAIDLPLNEKKKHHLGFKLNHRTQGEIGDTNHEVELFDERIRQVWMNSKGQLFLYEPLKTHHVRVNVAIDLSDYQVPGIWAWKDGGTVFKDWNTNTQQLIQKDGAWYYDILMNDSANDLGFLIVDLANKDKKTQDFVYDRLNGHTQLFIRDKDKIIYDNPYYYNASKPTGARLIQTDRLVISYTSVDWLDETSIKDRLTVRAGELVVPVDSVSIDKESNQLILVGNFQQPQSLTVEIEKEQFNVVMDWRLKDELYAYDGPLGLELTSDGMNGSLKLWSPSAQAVNLIIYDKKDPSKVIKTVALDKMDKGVWNIALDGENLVGESLIDYFYHFEVMRQGERVLVLDPYAKSLAQWKNPQNAQEAPLEDRIAKAAFVNPQIITKALRYADLKNYQSREDAIIYEVHVRDFTSDPTIENQLNKKQFGTFTAFIEKLDYIQSLGVTHVQLLPVMSYYMANEFENHLRELEYSSSDNNYNWGYDPQSYFALTGMYSNDPSNPTKRIQEFKELIEEIHKRNMGVILDVVYNHTAQTHIFEDLEPNYYHFMNADGTSRTSFGGGRLGTTHHMARRILVDSIKYWTEVFKVDGFRFDMMGDHDAESIQKAFDEAKKLNPNIIMIGEGWRTYAGDANTSYVQPADQDWVQHSEAVGVFSDEIRNMLKSGYPNEGDPRFLTGGAVNIDQLYHAIKGQPGNIPNPKPGAIVQYIEAHDNLTLFDIIAQSTKKDPKYHSEEILSRMKLGNTIILTSQGTVFIHAGQEYGRTKQFKHEDYRNPVDKAPHKSHLLTDQNGQPFDYPYFIHDSYDSSDAINHFDWSKATDSKVYPHHTQLVDYMRGLIELRHSTKAFRLTSRQLVDDNMRLITTHAGNDLLIAYQITDPETKDVYGVFINADTQKRSVNLYDEYLQLLKGDIIADQLQAGVTAIERPIGVEKKNNQLILDGLTSVIIKLAQEPLHEESEELTPPEKSEEELLPQLEENKEVPQLDEADKELSETDSENEEDTNNSDSEGSEGDKVEEDTPDKLEDKELIADSDPSKEDDSESDVSDSDQEGENIQPKKLDESGENTLEESKEKEESQVGQQDETEWAPDSNENAFDSIDLESILKEEVPSATPQNQKDTFTTDQLTQDNSTLRVNEPQLLPFDAASILPISTRVVDNYALKRESSNNYHFSAVILAQILDYLAATSQGENIKQDVLTRRSQAKEQEIKEVAEEQSSRAASSLPKENKQEVAEIPKVNSDNKKLEFIFTAAALSVLGGIGIIKRRKDEA